MNERPRDGRPSGDERDPQHPADDDEIVSVPEPAHSLPAARQSRAAEALRHPERVSSLRPVAAPRAASARQSGPRRSIARLYFEALIGTLVIWLFAVTFLIQMVEVPTESMLNTILVGDHLLVNRTVYGTAGWLQPVLPAREIQRGDVVVFKHPTDPQSLYVKRVVGLPGETIEVYGTRIYIDGQELPENKAIVEDTSADGAMAIVGEPSIADDATWTVYYSQLRDLGGTDDELAVLASVDRGTFGVGKPFTIPDRQYFCLGDNRDNSDDSRFWGTVPRENVIGRATLVYFSTGSGEGSFNFFSRVRWVRIGTLIQ